MKKLCIFTVVTLCILLVSCKNDSNTDTSNESLTPPEIIFQESETNENLAEETTYETEESHVSPLEPVEPEITELALKEVTLELQDTQIIDASPLYYTETLGSRKTYENMLPQIIGFEYPYVYYERMSAIVKDANPTDPDLYVGRYSIETKESQEFPIERFSAISSEARLVVNKDCLVYMYFLDGRMVSELFNFADTTRKILDDAPAHNVFGYPKKLSDNEIILFMYESTPDGARQKINLYDLTSDELVEIYRGDIMGGYKDSKTSTKDIFAITTYNNCIYLLMHQYYDNQMHSYIQKLDKNGNLLSEEKINALSQYNTLEDTADSLVIMGDYAIVHFMRINRSENNTNPLSAVLYHTNEGYKLFDVGEKIELNVYCGIGHAPLSTAFFGIHNDMDTIFACATLTNEGISININGTGVVASSVDSKGNLLVVTRENDNSEWYVVSSDQFINLCFSE